MFWPAVVVHRGLLFYVFFVCGWCWGSEFLAFVFLCRNDKITFELDEGQVNELMSSFRELKKKYPEGQRPDMPEIKPVCE